MSGESGVRRSGPALRVERAIAWIGRLSAWLFAVLLVAIVVQVGMNALFQPVTWMEELQWYLYGAASMVAMAYAMTRNGHVRVDVVSLRLSIRVRKWVETLWILFALVPLFAITVIHGWEFAVESLRTREGSPDPGGLPHRWIPKFFIPLAGLLLIAAALARAALVWADPTRLEESRLIHGD